MAASPTVENYLKAIYQGVQALPAGQRLLAMGQLATALSVAPGTATTMVKTLAESGLAEYEPYSGVRLTDSGERLAALVLRRHRLVELFLVKVMGLRWDEVHDEAEILEHAVSDRLIDRIDEMLGRPETDPHGDPIPNSEGAIKAQAFESLLTCPMGTTVTVTRVVDQDKAFLRFIESNNLKPGESIEVEERDTSSDSVRVRGRGNQRITIGTRAASKLLVQVVGILLAVLGFAATAHAQGAQPPQGSRPFEIVDNSFFVEEAFNQEAGIFQNIFGAEITRSGDWALAFTQEWPVVSQRHQFSYVLPFSSIPGARGFGDVLINYRLQATMEKKGVPAFSPRVSLVVPTGSAADGLGNGNLGWQVNLPVSKQAGDVFFHWNAGFTHTPRAESGSRTFDLLTPVLAGSAIVRVSPMFNLMLEALAQWDETPVGAATMRDRTVTLSPGFRSGWNIGDAQAIVGLAMPIAFSGGDTEAGVFGYFSYELPFMRTQP